HHPPDAAALCRGTRCRGQMKRRGFLSERAKKAAIKQLARSEQGASPRKNLFSLFLRAAAGGEKDLATALVILARTLDSGVRALYSEFKGQAKSKRSHTKDAGWNSIRHGASGWRR
ncbi:MAG TPA: hypothetical protein VF458_04235, partial [Ktedonobacteraceae bacterium]